MSPALPQSPSMILPIFQHPSRQSSPVREPVDEAEGGGRQHHLLPEAAEGEKALLTGERKELLAMS